MRVLVHQINVPLAYTDDMVRTAVARTLACRPEQIRNQHVRRRSLDARPHNPAPRYVLSVEATLDAPLLPRHLRPDAVQTLPDAAVPDPATTPARPRAIHTADRPLVVGAGPAGLLAALVLADAGARPLLVERGDAAVARAAKVGVFWHDGRLDPESNALFGEGGAGLFSDGKLTARTKDQQRCRRVLETLVACGASEQILLDAEPHIGSDRLVELVPHLGAHITAAGGERRFGARLDGLIVERQRVRAAVVNGEEIACSACVLAVGHSARDVYAMLAATGVSLAPKPLAVGVRVELPQAAIDRAQYGRFADDPRLGAASFRLTRRPVNDVRACYSFCMCPGGQVIACASEPGHLTTNGMSFSGRDLSFGNAGFLVPVGPEDYPADAGPALAGIAFQRGIEARAFAAGNGDYSLPATRLIDFLAGRASQALPKDRSCPRAVPAELGSVLPECVTHTLRCVLPKMLRELNGVAADSALVYAAETRSSSPVRITRDEGGQSPTVRGLFPAGEGAGYAGGIVSSAIDGIRAAEAVLAQL